MGGGIKSVGNPIVWVVNLCWKFQGMEKTCYCVQKRSTQGGNFCRPERGEGSGTFFCKWKLIGIANLLYLLTKTDKQILNTSIPLEQELLVERVRRLISIKYGGFILSSTRKASLSCYTKNLQLS